MHHLLAGVMMRGVTDAIEDRIAQPDVRRRHVDLRAQGARAVGKFACFHAREQIEIFLHRTIAKRPLFAEPAIFVGLLRRHVADVGFAFAHELLREFVELIEIVGGVKRRAVEFELQILIRPAVDQPMHVGHDRIDVFGLFLGRVGVVHPHVADAAELVRDAEVEADRLGVADVEIAVRLGRETGVDARVLSAPHIFCHDIADEIGWSGILVGRFGHAVARR